MKQIITLKQNSLIQIGDIAITANSNLLSLKRTSKEHTLELLINNGEEEEVGVYAENVIVENGFSNNKLKKNGFLIHSSSL